MGLDIQDFCKAYGFGCAILRYFNVAGAWPDGSLGENHEPETHLIPKILMSAVGKKEGSVRIFGTDYPTKDGTCIRDYVHVLDLAQAHLLAVQNILAGAIHIFNIGSENGFTVREVVGACEKVTGKRLRVHFEDRRVGDPPVLVASSQKIRHQLGWQPEYKDLEQMIAHAWKWHDLTRAK